MLSEMLYILQISINLALICPTPFTIFKDKYCLYDPNKYFSFQNGIKKCYDYNAVYPNKSSLQEVLPYYENRAIVRIGLNDMLEEQSRKLNNWVWPSGERGYPSVFKPITDKIGDCSVVSNNHIVIQPCYDGAWVACQLRYNEYNWKSRVFSNTKFTVVTEKRAWINKDDDSGTTVDTLIASSRLECVMKCSTYNYPCVSVYWSEEPKLCLGSLFIDSLLSAKYGKYLWIKYMLQL